jgi:acetyl-CoA C-acetyltransferase
VRVSTTATWASRQRTSPTSTPSARADQDLFAATSQQRTEAAQQAGVTSTAEIIPVEIPQRKGDPLVFAKDEFPRAGTTADTLAKLKPAFKKDGT